MQRACSELHGTGPAMPAVKSCLISLWSQILWFSNFSSHETGPNKEEFTQNLNRKWPAYRFGTGLRVNVLSQQNSAFIPSTATTLPAAPLHVLLAAFCLFTATLKLPACQGAE